MYISLNKKSNGLWFEALWCSYGFTVIIMNNAYNSCYILHYGCCATEAITWGNHDPMPACEVIMKAICTVKFTSWHYVIMSAMASQITGISIVCSTVCTCANQRKHQNSASLVCVRGIIHWWPVDSPRKEPETRKRFPINDVIMEPVNHLVITIPIHP